MAIKQCAASELIRTLPAKHLEPLKGGKVPIEILVRGKDAEQNAKQFEKCLDVIKGAGVRYMNSWLLYRSANIIQKKVGIIPKDPSAGPFADEWKKAYGDITKEVEEVDISLALSGAAFAVKDENELVSPSTRVHTHPEGRLCCAAEHAKCFKSLYRPSVRILRRGDVSNPGRREKSDAQRTLGQD